jgi:flagellar assembly protein FliH
MKMMSNTTKFTFDTVFSAGRDIATETARSRQRQVLTEAELEALRAEARAEGAQAGEVHALESIASGTREAAQALRDVLKAVAAQMESVRSDAAVLAFALARKVASTAVAQFPVGEVEAALRQAMHEAIGEPRIVLHARPEVTDALSGRIAQIAQEEGYDGRVQVSPDASLSGADCRIDWRGGGAERTNAAIEAALDELVARRFTIKDAGLQNRSEA